MAAATRSTARVGLRPISVPSASCEAVLGSMFGGHECLRHAGIGSIEQGLKSPRGFGKSPPSSIDHSHVDNHLAAPRVFRVSGRE